MKRLSLIPCTLLALILVLPVNSLADSVTYNLESDWSEINNPNGVWALRQGTTTLPYRSDIGAKCCSSSDGISGGWAPGSGLHDWLPFFVQSTMNTPGYNNGDILVHSVDSVNGDPALGEANLIWTAPSAGVIDISGGLWHGQWTLTRSNDFFLTLDGILLTQGTVGPSNPLGTPVSFNLTGLSVDAGDVIELKFQRRGAATITGIDLSIVHTTTVVPEPASAILLLTGLGLLSRFRRRIMK
jgi:hypothetical protein